MKKLLLALAVTFLGCGTDTPSGPEVLPDLTVPPKPANGVQIITPPFDDIQPGGDYEVCTWTDVHATHPGSVRHQRADSCTFTR